MPGAGKLTMKFEPEDGGKAIDYTVFDFKGAGVAMGMYNTEVTCILHATRHAESLRGTFS